MSAVNLEPARLYNLRTNVLTLNGERIQGSGPDEFITYEPLSDALESAVGADGFVPFSVLNDYRLQVTVNVMEGSISNGILARLQREQYAAHRNETSPSLSEIAYSHEDPIYGDVVTGSAVFTTFIPPSKGRTMGTREYTLVLPFAAANMELGTLL